MYVYDVLYWPGKAYSKPHYYPQKYILHHYQIKYKHHINTKKSTKVTWRLIGIKVYLRVLFVLYQMYISGYKDVLTGLQGQTA